MSLISVRNLGKSYRAYSSEWKRFASWFGVSVDPTEENWVLRNLRLDIEAGEAIGIVGQNGAGKSTFLKLIAGTLQPTEGQVQINGRISAILELGMGFNPELTGRQNSYHSAGLMGLDAEQTQQAMPAIEAFAEIGEYFDEPVRTYSSGMHVRVAFSIATAYRPEILVVDEALSVGDAYFQHKSFNRIREFQEQGTTLLIVSHDRNAIQNLCNRAILLENGNTLKDGYPNEVFDFYNALIAKKENTKIVQQEVNDRVETISGTGEATVTEIKLFNAVGESTKTFKVGEAVELHITVEIKQSVDSLVLGCGITDRLGQMMFGTNTWHTKQVIHDINEGDIYVYKVAFMMNLGVGSYAVHCSLVENESHIYKNYEWRDGAFVFEVINADKEIFVGCMWNKMDFNIEKVTPG